MTPRASMYRWCWLSLAFFLDCSQQRLFVLRSLGVPTLP
jgi:hypothetical protein